jgi:hypothetical protein
MKFSRPLIDIEKSISIAVFLGWMERLPRCIATNGQDFEEVQKGVAGKIIFIRKMGRRYAYVGQTRQLVGRTALHGASELLGYRLQPRANARLQEYNDQFGTNPAACGKRQQLICNPLSRALSANGVDIH